MVRLYQGRLLCCFSLVKSGRHAHGHGYRAHALNVRIKSMHASTLSWPTQNKAVEPLTIVIIARYFGGVFCRPMQ